VSTIGATVVHHAFGETVADRDKGFPHRPHNKTRPPKASPPATTGLAKS
jgi:hypothetical protein